MSITSQLNIVLNLLISQYYTYKFFHWNFVGEDFYSYHQLFDSHASNILASQDVIAERTRQLGFKVSLDTEIRPVNTIEADQKNLSEILNHLILVHNSIIEPVCI